MEHREKKGSLTFGALAFRQSVGQSVNQPGHSIYPSLSIKHSANNPVGLHSLAPFKRSTYWEYRSLNPFIPKSEQVQISPAASAVILHYTVRRTWLFIANSDQGRLYYKFSLYHFISSPYKRLGECPFLSSGLAADPDEALPARRVERQLARQVVRAAGAVQRHQTRADGARLAGGA